MVLERNLGLSLDHVDPSAPWNGSPEIIGNWIADAGVAIVQAAVNAAAVIDFAAIRIDGAISLEIKDRLIDATRTAYRQLNTRGLSPLEVLAGTAGPDARSIWAAILPILANYPRDNDLLLKPASR